MCSSTAFMFTLAICFKLVDFTGDGFMFYKMITEYFRYVSRTSFEVSSFSSGRMDGNYCRSWEHFDANQNDLNQHFVDFSVTLLSYGISVLFTFVLIPGVFCISLPKKTRSTDVDEEEDDLSIEYEFCEEESVKKRALRYGALLVILFLHNILSLTLGISSFSYIVSPQGFRCSYCYSLYEFQRCPYNSTQARGWSSSLLFPAQNDYFLLIFIGGKLVGAVGISALALFLELQYRYHIYLMKAEQFRQVIRRHFRGTRGSEKKPGCCLPWFASLLFAIFFFFWILLLTVAPTTTVILFRYDISTSLISGSIRETFLYLCYVSWGSWGLFLLIFLFGTWTVGISSRRN